MPKLEEILKKNGYSDEDLAAMGTLLSDARFRSSLEQEFGAVITERDQLKARDQEWQTRLDTQYNPAIANAEKLAMDARLEAAKYKEIAAMAKDFGYVTEDQERAALAAEAAKAQQGQGGFDPQKYVNWDDARKMLDGEGEAIAMVADLTGEYSLMFGKSLYEYEGPNGRGLRALRQEAKQARKPLDQYVSEKFNFNGRRGEMAAAKQKEHDDRIRKEAGDAARAEMASQFGNPNMRQSMPSALPFIPNKPGGDGKQPWERGPAQQLRSERIQRTVERNMQQGRPS